MLFHATVACLSQQMTEGNSEGRRYIEVNVCEAMK